MVVLENGLLLDGVLYAVLDLIRRLFRFEVHQTSGVLSVFEDMTSADCPDHLCVKQKAISKEGESIICLPNKVVVTVKSDMKSDIDSISK